MFLKLWSTKLDLSMKQSERMNKCSFNNPAANHLQFCKSATVLVQQKRSKIMANSINKNFHEHSLTNTALRLAEELPR